MDFVQPHGHTWLDVCAQPWLAHLHGALVRPNSRRFTTRLLPLFASCRVAGVETAMVMPDELNWGEDDDYHAETDVGWRSKTNKAFWRGSNTGGAHDATNWRQFHRHRFVALTNATYLRGIASGKTGEDSSGTQVNEDWALALPLRSLWESVGVKGLDVAIDLMEKYVDTGFTDFLCHDDKYRGTRPLCSYLVGISTLDDREI